MMWKFIEGLAGKYTNVRLFGYFVSGIRNTTSQSVVDNKL